MHVHLPTGDWVCGCVGHYLDSVERYFGREVAQTTATYMEYQGTGWMV